MAWNTDRSLRNRMIYCVFVRNYSPEGTFEKVREDLPRIRDLGTDILWFLPIHPIGAEKRKGILGSPYAIRDYRAVNDEYGTMEDFRALAPLYWIFRGCVEDAMNQMDEQGGNV